MLVGHGWAEEQEIVENHWDVGGPVGCAALDAVPSGKGAFHGVAFAAGAAHAAPHGLGINFKLGEYIGNGIRVRGKELLLDLEQFF